MAHEAIFYIPILFSFFSLSLSLGCVLCLPAHSRSLCILQMKNEVSRRKKLEVLKRVAGKRISIVVCCVCSEFCISVLQPMTAALSLTHSLSLVIDKFFAFRFSTRWSCSILIVPSVCVSFSRTIQCDCYFLRLSAVVAFLAYTCTSVDEEKWQVNIVIWHLTK